MPGVAPVLYSDRYQIDIGSHVFPTAKYRLVRDRLLADGLVSSADLIEPQPAGWDQLALIHTPEYLAKLRTGTLTREDTNLLELPWSGAMIDAFRAMVGGTIRAATLACGIDMTAAGQTPGISTRGPGLAIHIGGGLHHAFPNHGEGFCPLNDIAIAVRTLQSAGLSRSAIVDLDVHHGNGTAFIFESDPRVFTFSMHQQYNYPLWKPRSSIDIGLPDGAGDARFLRDLGTALPQVLASGPECVFYLAGADPYVDDQLGGLRMTMDGLRQRDRMVIDAVRGASVPLVVTLAGGYARRVADTVAIHVATIQEALRSFLQISVRA